jgi:hypothetical protein
VLRHLFFRCPFVKNCWRIIGINVPTCLKPERATRHIKRFLRVPFAMEIIIVMCWCIWNERNAWIFNSEDPGIEKCKMNFKREFSLVIHKTKKRWAYDMEPWLSSIV